ncbi:MAG: SusE domain-containing protein [Bacteroidota bacterium]|nr:SusE domain-containing protein [Bacteroidota bacterium]
MKILKYITLISIFAIALMACEDDDELTKIDENNFVAPVLSGIDVDEEFVLVKDTTDVDSLKATWADLVWTEADYGQALATKYTVQIDKVGNEFENAFEFNASSNTELSVLVEEVNTKMFNMGDYYPPLVKANVEIRVKAEVSEHVSTLYSEVIPFYLTPYDAGKPKLYVTGTHQLIDWDFASAPTLYALNEDEEYVGYIYLTDCEYLLNKNPDYYWGAGTSEGTIAVGGAELTNVDEGMYWMIVDTLAETISTELRNWGLIGSSTPGGWDTDTNMEWDAESGRLKVTLDLTQSGDLAETGIKFRANDAWDINLGDDEGDGILEEGGKNIAVPEAGNYTVYLDLSNPERFTYELIKN